MKSFFLFFILVTCMTISCSKIDIDIDRTTFDKEYAAWNAQNIENYTFTFDYRSGGGPNGPITIALDSNEPVIIDNRTPQLVPIATSISEIYSYINETFDNIERQKNSSNKRFTIESISLRINYNKQFHYPEKVSYRVSYKQKLEGQPHYNLNITEFVLN